MVQKSKRLFNLTISNKKTSSSKNVPMVIRPIDNALIDVSIFIIKGHFVMSLDSHYHDDFLKYDFKCMPIFIFSDFTENKF